MKTILTIIKKELTRFFTDKRMLLALILPGILIFVIYSLLGNVMGDLFQPSTTHEYIVYIENQPEEFQVFETAAAENYNIQIKQLEGKTKEEIKNEIKNEEADLLICYDGNFLKKVQDYTMSDGENAPQVQMYYNSVSTTSSAIYEYYVACLESFESSISNKFDVNGSLDVQYDLATKEDVSISVITMLFPFLIIILLFTGCMSIATESIAGEKERGTMATLLVTPIKRSNIAIGKMISLSIIAMVSALSSFLGILFSLPNLLSGSSVDINTSMYGVKEYIGLLLVIITTVLVFVVVLSMVSCFAKSIKEASNYAIPLMVLCMLIAMSTMMQTSQDTPSLITYIIPVYNSAICLKDIVSLHINWLSVLVTCGSNLIVVCLGIFGLAKMFNNEKIMFTK